MSNSCKNTRYGTPRHGGPAVRHVIHVSPCLWVCGGGLLQTEGEGRSVTSVSFVPLLQITPAGGRRHGRGGARTWLPLPAPTTATSEWLHNTSFSKYQFIHVQSIQRHCIIWTLEACVYVLWVSVLKSNVSLFTVRVGPPSSVISKPLSHYCITHRRGGVVG